MHKPNSQLNYLINNTEKLNYCISLYKINNIFKLFYKYKMLFKNIKIGTRYRIKYKHTASHKKKTGNTIMLNPLKI